MVEIIFKGHKNIFNTKKIYLKKKSICLIKKIKKHFQMFKIPKND
jgi:hypothetical protein